MVKAASATSGRVRVCSMGWIGQCMLGGDELDMWCPWVCKYIQWEEMGRHHWESQPAEGSNMIVGLRERSRWRPLCALFHREWLLIGNGRCEDYKWTLGWASLLQLTLMLTLPIILILALTNQVWFCTLVYVGSKCCLSLDMCTSFAKPCEYARRWQMSRWCSWNAHMPI